MNSLEPTIQLLLNMVNGWVFASLGIGLLSGFLIGRWYTLARERLKIRKSRNQALTSLTTLLTSTEKLNDDVGEHNNALAVAQEDLSSINANGTQAGDLQGRLLDSITHMAECNRKLENELVVSRYQLEQQAQQLDITKREARTDAVSSLGNRKAFDEAMAFFASRLRTKNKSYALMLIDVDYFKRINDTFGHAAGDKVLASIGQSLIACVRPTDQVFRIGGDEFGVLLDRVDAKVVSAVGKRLRSAIEMLEFEVGRSSESTVVTLSMGLTVAEDADSAETLFVRADEALYQSKERGRNRLTIKSAQRTEEIASVEPPPKKEQSTSYERFKSELENSELSRT